ncbi:unnamed protein product, partial [Adineta ricciae]
LYALFSGFIADDKLFNLSSEQKHDFTMSDLFHRVATTVKHNEKENVQSYAISSSYQQSVLPYLTILPAMCVITLTTFLPVYLVTRNLTTITATGATATTTVVPSAATTSWYIPRSPIDDLYATDV